MHLYSVPVVQADLRHEETIIQAANALALLQQTIDSVFDRIDARIAANVTRIAHIDQRLDAANRLGQQLIGMRRAIRIRSPAEYPRVQCPDVPATFAAATGGHPPAEDAPERMPYTVRTPLDPSVAQHKAADDKLQFYHVRSGAPHGRSARSDGEDGLGPWLPAFAGSVDALLLHNNGENVYTDYKKAEAQQRNIGKRAPQAATGAGGTAPMADLGAAPPSISNRQRELHSQRAAEELFYAPSSTEAPPIEMPMDLPDLPGIAQNVELSAATRVGRPSTITTGNVTGVVFALPDLPDIADGLTRSISSSDRPSSSAAAAVMPPPPPIPTDVVTAAPAPMQPPPPPPPPPPPLPPSASVDDAPMMPPPPPPPPVLRSATVAVEPKVAAVTDAAAGGDVNDRSNLMAAIRQAAGQKTLRATSMIETRSARKEPPPAATSGNLMDDLHRRLALRRKGISGSKRDTDGESAAASSTVAPPPPGGLMNRIASMIPPPPRDASSGTSDDDEWN